METQRPSTHTRPQTDETRRETDIPDGPDLTDRSRPTDSQTTEAISFRLSDRRRRGLRRLLLRELAVELVNLARRRRELRSQATKAGGGGDHRRHCRQYFSGDAAYARRGTKDNRATFTFASSRDASFARRDRDRATSSSGIFTAQRIQEPFFCVIFLLFCDQNHSIPRPSNSTSKQVKLANY